MEPDPRQTCTGCDELLPIGRYRKAGTYRDGTPRRSRCCRSCERSTGAGGKKRRRSLIASRRVGRITRADIEAIGARQGWKCACGCGRPIRYGFHVDHRVPLAKGGLHALANLQLLAPVCNLRKGAR